MGSAEFRERIGPMVRTEVDEQRNWVAAWTAKMKTAIAEVAAMKSSQRLGREEEKE
jgi:hypothetical protein